MKDKTLEEEVIHYFRANKENTIPAIARRFNIAHTYVITLLIISVL